LQGYVIKHPLVILFRSFSRSLTFFFTHFRSRALS
jgi:hypothetical protein